MEKLENQLKKENPEIINEKIINGLREKIKKGNGLSFEYGSHGHFDIGGYHGKYFVEGKDKLSTCITNIMQKKEHGSLGPDDSDYLPEGEKWEYIAGPDIDLTEEESKLILKKIEDKEKELKQEYDGVKKSGRNCDSERVYMEQIQVNLNIAKRTLLGEKIEESTSKW